MPLSSGKQNVLVQHRQSIREFLGFGFGRLVVPQLGVPATSLLAQINYPRQWTPLLESFSTRTRVWRPSTELLLVFVVLLLWTERALAYLLVPWRQRATIALFVAAAAAAFDAFALLVVVADAALTIGWLVPLLKRETWTFLKGLVAFAVVGAGVALLMYNLQMRKSVDNMTTYSGSGGIAAVTDTAPVVPEEITQYQREASSQQNAIGLSRVGRAPVKQQTNYQGLPARFEIPLGDRHSYFGQEMLPTDREHAIAVVLVSSTIVWLIGAVLVALAVWQLWRARAAIGEGLRTRFTPPQSPVPLPSS